jgi:mannan endo-1,4-beta-mannosidase
MTGSLGRENPDGTKRISELTSNAILVHRYAGGESANQNQWKNSVNSWLQKTNKLIYIEEWGVDTTKYTAATEFPANTQDMNSAAIPWLYWQVLPNKECPDTGSDTFGIHMGSGTDFASQMKAASNAQALQDWTGVIW